MTTYSTSRLDNRQWGQRLAALAVAACDAELAEEIDIFRQAHALLAMAPHGQSRRFGPLPGHQRFEALLATGAGESAALALLPVTAAYIVSRGNNGVNLASVMLDGDDEEVAAEATTAGLALIAAMAGALRFTVPVSGKVVDFDALEMMSPPLGLMH